ncbi:MAG: histidine kinase [Amycolatopsis sp.]|nr:histidine kinase [Amycolatopsis sp.]
MPTKDTSGAGGDSAHGNVPADQPGKERAVKRTGSLFGVRHWKLRSKLAVILIVPTLTALVLGGLRATDELQQAQQFQQTVSQVDFAIKVTATIHELQQERVLSVIRIASKDPAQQAPLDSEIAKVDSFVADLHSSASKLDTDQATKDRYNQGLQRLDALKALRSAIGTSSYSDASALNAYSAILSSLVQLGREVTTSVTNRELLRQATVTQSLTEAKEFIARGDAALEIGVLHNEFPGDLLQQVIDGEASGQAAIDQFSANATPQQEQLYTDTYSGAEVDDRQRIRVESLAANNNQEPPNINSAQLATDSNVSSNKLRAVETSLLNDMRTQANSLASSVTSSAWWEIGIVLAALIVALILMLAIARLMLRPLRVLRTTALEVAYTRLPETVQAILDDPDPIRASQRAVTPVPITSRDEIGEVARSFDAVHEQAVRMASEQALLRENVNGIFVNLSRRSQRLVERQLGVIDRLEADEQDPDHLASLFELDHLATRLRRNGESLLVLSGAGLAKSVPKPVPAADVIGAAVSEIEQYARIEVGAVPDVAVQGLTIHDLVHVLAELLDNATYFSEPETKITVRAVVTRKKALAIQVTDHGVGMSEDQIAEVNQRLADPPDLDVSVTRRMGLYVVARLAQRHGIEVRLRENEDIEGGVIARVLVPANLLTSVRVDPRLLQSASRSETSGQSIPPINRSFEDSSSRSYADSTQSGLQPYTPPDSPAPLSSSPAAPVKDANGLTPLEKPISLDDLVGGNNAAFLSSPTSAPNPLPTSIPSASDLPVRQPAESMPAWPTSEDHTYVNGEGASGDDDAKDTQYTPLVLPKRQPKYVPVTPAEEPEPAEPAYETGSTALEDDVPTRRLPIYQSVLSRWFSEDGDEAESAERAAEAAQAPSTDFAEYASSASTVADEGSGGHDDLGGLEGFGSPQVSREEERIEPVEASSWQSASDSGWQAAQALLESKDEEITPAGLPKRVPNAYLVPGSVNTPEQPDVFADVAAGLPGKASIARSATAARSRMASFQRGYTSGRHAMKEQPAAGRGADEGVSVSGGSMSSSSEDSSEEWQ